MIVLRTVDAARLVEVPEIVPLPHEAICPLTSVHPAVVAWRVFHPCFGLSLAQVEAVCRAFVEREEERRALFSHGSTADWAVMAGRF